MQKKSFKAERGRTSTITIFLVILIIAIIAVVFLKLSNINRIDNSTKNTVDNSITNQSSDYSTSDTTGTIAILNGFKSIIPSEMECKVNVQGKSIALSDEDLTIEMSLKVTDISYEEIMKTPEKLIEKAKNANYKIIQNMKETVINGTECAYYTCEGQGIHNLVVYAKGNSKKKIGAQIITDEKYESKALDIFTKIAKSATEISEKDSTEKDFQTANTNNLTKVEYDVSYTKNITSSNQAIVEIKEEAERQRKKYNNPKIKELETEMEDKYDIIAVVL